MLHKANKPSSSSRNCKTRRPLSEVHNNGSIIIIYLLPFTWKMRILHFFYSNLKFVPLKNVTQGTWNSEFWKKYYFCHESWHYLNAYYTKKLWCKRKNHANKYLVLFATELAGGTLFKLFWNYIKHFKNLQEDENLYISLP